MKTKDSLSGLKNLIDNISFEDNPNVERASQAISDANQEYRNFFGLLRGWTGGLDVDNGYVEIFIPLDSFNGISAEEKERFLTILRKKFGEAHFEILHEGDLGGDVYFHVGYASRHFILKSLI